MILFLTLQSYSQNKPTPNVTMDLNQRIDALVALGHHLNEIAVFYESDEAKTTLSTTIQETLTLAGNQNGWFTPNNLHFALTSWAKTLTKENLTQWAAQYQEALQQNKNQKTVAIIMAGNIPLVGFHDFLSVIISGHKALIKLSSNDKVLLPYLTDFLIEYNPEFKDLIHFSDEKLQGFDAVIATGSDNTAKYFEYYFKKHPHIIRKNRNSVAILDGNESIEDLKSLANDIFRYFGLGCRSVSKIYVPENYDFKTFFEAMFEWKEIIHNHKYINNYDYNKAVYLMSNIALLDNEFMLLKNDEALSSPIAVLFYEYYNSRDALDKTLQQQADRIQCIVSNSKSADIVPFGMTQTPKLWDYPDGVDTLKFLTNLD